MLEIRYADGSTFRIAAPDGERIAQGLFAAESTLERASLSDDDGVRADADPLADLRDEKGFSHGAHAIRIGEKWTRSRELHPALVAFVILASIGLAPSLLELRNRWSDDAAFAYAHHENIEAHYTAYLAHGDLRHATYVRDVLLPRVALTTAEGHDSDAELGDFLGRFPSSVYEKEARDRLEQTCSAHFFQANAPVESFIHQHPQCAPLREAMLRRMYDEVRRNLVRTDMVPAFRDALVKLVDEAQRKDVRERLNVIVAGPSYQQLRGSFEALLHVVAIVFPQAKDTGLLLTMRDVPFECPAGMVPWVDARVVGFELTEDGHSLATWQATLHDDSQLFEAATSRHFDRALCQPRPVPR